jgi:hypothetical protein
MAERLIPRRPAASSEALTTKLAPRGKALLRARVAAGAAGMTMSEPATIRASAVASDLLVTGGKYLRVPAFLVSAS